MYRTNIRSLKSVRFGEIGAHRVLMKQLVGREDGAEKTALHEIRIQKAGRTSVHRHNWQHQIYVTSGRGVLIIGDKRLPLKAGDVLVIARGEEHGFVQRGTPPFVFLTVTPL